MMRKARTEAPKRAAPEREAPDREASKASPESKPTSIEQTATKTQPKTGDALTAQHAEGATRRITDRISR